MEKISSIASSIPIINERFWRSLKYKQVYLKSYETVIQAKENIGSYIKFYNYEREHQTPEKYTFKNLKERRRRNLI